MLSTPEHLAHASLRFCGYRSLHVATTVGRVHVLDASGSGPLPTVVMLHGFSSAALHYAPLIQRLRPHVERVIAPDLPAHGYSDVPRGGVTPAGLRRGLFDALDALIDRPVILLGNSMGGLAAVQYALARPERVRGLVLMSPAGAAMTTAELSALVRSLTMESHDEALAFVDRLLVRRAPSLIRPLIAWGVRQKFGHPQMRRLLASLSREDLLAPEQLAQLAMPTMLVWGRGDRILPAACREFYLRHLPAHARIEQPEGFSHSPYLEDPDAVHELLLRFVRHVGATPALAARSNATMVDAAAVSTALAGPTAGPIVPLEATLDAPLGTDAPGSDAWPAANAKKPDHVSVAGLSLVTSS